MWLEFNEQIIDTL